MAEPFLSEIRILSFNFPPKGWAKCDGAVLPISQNQSLFSLLGTSFGGDGRSTFALPDLRGRAAIHPGAFGITNRGQKAGLEAVPLLEAEIPSHTHSLQASNSDATGGFPTNNLLARATTPIYHAATNLVDMKTSASPAVTNTGGGQPHNNMQPFQALNFCIALQGIFPSNS